MKDVLILSSFILWAVALEMWWWVIRSSDKAKRESRQRELKFQQLMQSATNQKK